MECLYIIKGWFHFQTFVLSYTFIKYNRKVKDIPYKYITFDKTLYSNYPLFCINKDPYHYLYITGFEEKIVFENLFPNPINYYWYGIINLDKLKYTT